MTKHTPYGYMVFWLIFNKLKYKGNVFNFYVLRVTPYTKFYTHLHLVTVFWIINIHPYKMNGLNPQGTQLTLKEVSKLLQAKQDYNGRMGVLYALTKLYRDRKFLVF